MKPFQLLFLAFVLSITFGLLNQSYSQSIYFCEGVDDDGEPIDESSTFTIPEDGGYLYILVQLPDDVGCRSVSFEIYRNGKYDNTIKMDTERSWTWFWKKITFYKTGEFTVDVYDCNDDLLVTGTVDIDKD
jgi:hypothetical protein